MNIYILITMTLKIYNIKYLSKLSKYILYDMKFHVNFDILLKYSRMFYYIFLYLYS